jgi:hypothetical protein
MVNVRLRGSLSEFGDPLLCSGAAGVVGCGEEAIALRKPATRPIHDQASTLLRCATLVH